MSYRCVIIAAVLLSSITLRAEAIDESIAISGVPVELVAAEALPSEWERYLGDERIAVVLDGSWSFDRADIIEVDDAGQPMVVRFALYRLPLEMRLLTDPGILDQETLVGIIEPSWLDASIERALNGRCSHEPGTVGIIEPSFLNPDIADGLDRAVLMETVVAITETGFTADAISFIDTRYTSGVQVGIINPDSMHPGGWCQSNAWVSWEDCRGCLPAPE